MVRRLAPVKWSVFSRSIAAVGAVLLCVGATGFTLASPTSPAAVNKQQSSPGSANPALAEPDVSDRLPRSLSRLVRRDLAQRLDVSPRQLRVSNYSRQTWSDSCLGLGTAAELCAQALVPGWQVELTDGEQTWVYHTDETGQTMRLQEPAASSDNLPEAVGDRILEAASDDSGLPKSDLTLVDAQQRTWDGCLGIASVEGVCTQIAISGWQVIVAGETGSWIYHSDGEGADIRLNETASLPDSSIAPSFIPAEQAPPAAEPGVIFKAITEGGITGSSSQVLLMEDGQVVQFADDQGVSTATELNRLSPEQVQAFSEFLQQQLFGNLNHLDYPAPAGAADYRTVTLIGQGGTTRYADIVQDQLPSALQQVIQTWNQTIAE